MMSANEPRCLRPARVGVYVDVDNLTRNGGRGLRFDVLRDFACRGGAEPVRLNAYLSYDAERAKHDRSYARGQEEFHSLLRDFGYKVIVKSVRWYTDDAGRRIPKANSDLELAVDALLQSENLDRVVLATGDGDFVQVVRALQNRGCRVEVLGFDNVSAALRREADMAMSGYLVPNLLPTATWGKKEWGEVGSVVRGVCYSHPGKGYGFFRFLRRIDGELWRTDTRRDDSPYGSAFFHNSQLPPEVRWSELPSRSLVFEFELAPGRDDTLQAMNIRLVSPKRRPRELLAPESLEEGATEPGESPAADPRAEADDASDVESVMDREEI